MDMKMAYRFGFSNAALTPHVDSPFLTAAKALECKAEVLEELCGEVLATLVVNRDRGTLQPVEESMRADWNAILERWQKRLAKIRA